jgi:hypothetical protein
MMRPSTTALLILAAASPAALPAYAADSDEQFFRSVQGVWTGPGEIVAGKFKGTKFTCKLNGTTPSGKVGMTLDGSCRVGVFSQRMSASVERKGRGYRGTFLDGAGGEGLDIVSGSVDGRKVTFSIARNQLNGADPEQELDERQRLRPRRPPDGPRHRDGPEARRRQFGRRRRIGIRRLRQRPAPVTPSTTTHPR